MLRLLSLLQSRREFSGAELAERLDVTERTLRRDIDRLRQLDYPVHSSTGTTGGYRLGPGTNLPPLVLDDDEAVSVAAALVTAAGGSVSGIEEASTRALAKLRQVLPARLRPRLAAVTGATAAIPYRDTPRVDPAVFTALASCCRDQEIVSFDYRSRHNERTARRVEPHSLVTVQAHWYLVAFDPQRADWRTFRVDRVADPRPTHRRFTARELPAPDAATFVTRSMTTAAYRHTARITVQLPANTVRRQLHTALLGEVEVDESAYCTIRLSAESPVLVTQQVAAIAALGAEYTLHVDDDIASRVSELGRSLQQWRR